MDGPPSPVANLLGRYGASKNSTGSGQPGQESVDGKDNLTGSGQDSMDSKGNLTMSGVESMGGKERSESQFNGVKMASAVQSRRTRHRR